MSRRFSFALILGFLLIACAGRPRPETVEGRAGRFLPRHGFSIDARYDPKLDDLVPRYKPLAVAIRNTSLRVIFMDARKDRWFLVDGGGKKIRAVNSLRLRDPKVWGSLPEGVRRLVDYPEVVPISYTATFNLFFPAKASLKGFREVHYWNAFWNENFRISAEE